MALVKKLQTGGSVVDNSMENEINNQLSNLNLKSKDERKVRDALGQLMGHLSKSEENKFTVDPVTKKYTVTGSGSEAFSTDTGDLGTNWLTGKVKVGTPQDAMKLALLTYNEAKNKSNIPTATQTTKGDEVKLGDLGEYLQETVYGGEGNFRTDFGTLKTDEERKAKVFAGAKSMLEKYRQEAQSNPNMNYSDMSNLSELEDAIKSNDWDKFKTASYKMKWEPSSLLLTESQKEQIKADNTSKEVSTLSPTEQQYASAGYNKLDESWTPDKIDPNWFRKILSENNARVLSNPVTGKHMIVNPSGVFNYSQTNPFQEGYGFGWTSDEVGARAFTPETSAALFGEDEYANRNVGRELKIEGLGNIKSAIGWSGQIGQNYAKDILGRRDFTKELVITDANGRRIKLIKQDDGSYKDERGLTQKPIITGYGTEVQDIFKYKDVFPSIPSINPGAGYNYLDSYRTLAKSINAGEVSPNITKEASKLLWTLGYDDSVKRNPELKGQIQDLLTMYQKNLKTASFKNGGVLKFQSGAKFREYAQSIKGLKKTQPQTPEQKVKKIRNIEGTFKDQSAAENILDTASMIGAGLSFIPGVGGVIGGGVSLASDIAKDVVKDGFQLSDIVNTNTAINIAGMGLGAFGLGGLTTLLKAGKVADKVGDITKIVNKVSKVNLTGAEKESLESLANLSKKLGVSSVKELSEKAATLSAADKAVVEQGMKTINVIGSSSPKFLGSTTLGSAGKATMEGLAKIKVTPKTLGRVAKTATLIPGGIALGETAKDVASGEVDSFEDLRARDLKNIILGASAAKHGIQSLRTTKAINRQSLYNEIPDKTMFNLGGNEVTINRSFNIPKPPKNIFGKSFGKDKYEASAKETRSQIGEALKKEGRVLTEEEIKELGELDLNKVTLSKGSKTPSYSVGDFPKSATGDRTIDTRDYNIAKKYLMKEETTKVIPPPKASDKSAVSAQDPNIKVPPPPPPPVIKKSTVKKTSNPKAKSNRLKDKKISKKASGGNLLPGITVTAKRLPSFAKPLAAVKPTKMNWNPSVSGTLSAPTANKGLLPGAKSVLQSVAPSFDETDIANTLMLANTLSTNTKVGNLQRQGIAEGIYRLPTIAKQNIRVDAPMGAIGQTESGKLMSQAGNISRATSDIDKSMAVKLSGANQAAEIRGKYNAMDQDRIDKLRAMQQDANARASAYNTEVVGKNRAISADAAKNLSLISANQSLAQNTAVNNFITSFANNLKRKEFRLGQKELFAAYNKPEYKSAIEAYKNALSDNTKNKYYKQWEAQKSSFYKTPWEQSQFYKGWQSDIDKTKASLELVNKPLENLKAEQSLRQSMLFLKKGGSLSKEDRLDIERFKMSNKIQTKNAEMAFKAILQNNEMLQKALIKVFK